MEGFFDGRKTRALFPSRVHLWGFQFFGGRKTRASFPSLLWRDFLMGEKLALYNCSHRCTRALSIFRWAREKNSRVTPIEFGRSKLITEYNFHRFCRFCSGLCCDHDRDSIHHRRFSQNLRRLREQMTLKIL